MNRHVTEYHYYTMCQLEKTGKIDEALDHLRMMWMEIQLNG